MARYTIAVTGAAAAANAALADLAAAASDQVSLLELHLFNTAATLSDIALARTTAIGTRTTPTTVVPEDPTKPPGTATSAVAWSVAPTISATNMRAATLPANIGAGIMWTWAVGQLIVPVSGSIVVVNRGAGAVGATRITFVVDE